MISLFYKTDDQLWNSGLFQTLLDALAVFSFVFIVLKGHSA